ncbi:HU family DNA-binding protein [Primorskyibacter sedentarius]|uniref:HU family DNA-binding protein n=1 Tax=Primorskyibacter sedentarius TaxID=745311 RepID=UPI003EBE0472
MAVTRKTSTTTPRTTKSTKAKTPTSTAPKPEASKPVVTKPAQVADTAGSSGLGAAPDASLVLRKKELIDLVVERCPVKKRDAKPAIEAALAVLGEALSKGREVNIPPLGKIKVKRSKRVGNAQISTLHLRQADRPTATADDPLAQTEE